MKWIMVRYFGPVILDLMKRVDMLELEGLI